MGSLNVYISPKLLINRLADVCSLLLEQDCNMYSNIHISLCFHSQLSQVTSSVVLITLYEYEIKKMVFE